MLSILKLGFEQLTCAKTLHSPLQYSLISNNYPFSVQKSNFCISPKLACQNFAKIEENKPFVGMHFLLVITSLLELGLGISDWLTGQ